MNRELKIVQCDEKHIYLLWSKDDIADSFTIVGLNKSFYKEKIKTTKKNYALLETKNVMPYLNLSVIYQRQDEKTKQDFIISETNAVDLDLSSIKSISIKCLPSYRGISMSLSSDEIYDKYYIYEKNKEDLKLLFETEDFHIISDKIKEGNKYYVEGYKKKNGGYQLCGKSSLYTCKFEKITNSTNPILTVVIPVYNAELFVDRCIDSILLSSFKSTNIIVVNDGSTDKSLTLINWYQKKYPKKITVFNQENKGVSFARNKGIEETKTPYIAFIDSDDLVHPFMYEKLYNYIQENNLDVAISKTLVRKDYGDNYFVLNARKKENCIYTFDEMATNLDRNTYDNIFFHSSCNKILKTQLVKEHPFPDYNEYEDVAFTMSIYSYIDNFGFVPEAYYIWDQRFRKITSSLSTRYFEKDTKMNIQPGYRDSVFYCCYHGNKKRIDYLLYHSIKMAYNYMKEAKINVLNNIYHDEIMKLSKTYDLINNTFIKNYKELNIYIQLALKKSN